MKVLQVLMAYLLLMSIAFVPVGSAKVEQPTKEKPLVLKLSTVGRGKSAKIISAKKLKEMVEQRTGGKVKIDIHSAGELYKDSPGLVAASTGTIFCQQVSLEAISKWEKGFEITALYGLYDDEDHFVRFLKNEKGGKELIRRLEKKGLMGEVYLSNPWRLWTKVKVTKAEQLDGMPLRTAPAKVEAESMKALGCRVFSLPAGELYTAATTGMIDGVVTLPLAVGTRKLDEVFKFCVIKPAFKQNGVMYAMSKVKLEGMPADIRKIVVKSVRESCEWMTGKSKELDQWWIDELTKRGVTFVKLDPAEWAKFDAKFRTVRQKYREALGDLMQVVEKTR